AQFAVGKPGAGGSAYDLKRLQRSPGRHLNRSVARLSWICRGRSENCRSAGIFERSLRGTDELEMLIDREGFLERASSDLDGVSVLGLIDCVLNACAGRRSFRAVTGIGAVGGYVAGLGGGGRRKNSEGDQDENWRQATHAPIEAWVGRAAGPFHHGS